MTPLHTHIDIERLNSQIGHRSDLLSRLADAFIRQLESWQTDFAQRLQAGDIAGVGRLLHWQPNDNKPAQASYWSGMAMHCSSYLEK